ncbi:hypothetical protein [Bradyrhizobium sp. CCBAU 53415]|uniref:hypothetical protein n=1 Tax=Bradyrhizobium sp. CCBAU 53415 TaxID=1325119 RepID=UPI0023060032|nr:hypothetical protein [Bradyrhizobium sp. CCBAU 53415]MDA9466923.1 hypothetical protein [Bradyrhizobium sp. CCBAU 53415]
MAGKPSRKEFGKRQPAAEPPSPRPPVKRSGHVALLVMGTLAVGTTAYTLMPRQNCEPPPPGTEAAAQASTACSSRSGSSSGGSSSRWSSRSSFFSGDSSSHSAPSVSGSHGVSRGGFGSFGHGFSGGG